MPFVDLVRNGASIIAGGDQLEIGRAGLFEPIQTGTYAILRAKADEVPLASLTFAENSRELRSNGKTVQEHPYMVIRIQASPVRPYFYNIPDLKPAFHQMKEQFKRTPKDIVANNVAFDAFDVSARLFPDLLSQHASALVAKVREQYQIFLIEGRRSGTVQEQPAFLDLELADFKPFADSSDSTK